MKRWVLAIAVVALAAFAVWYVAIRPANEATASNPEGIEVAPVERGPFVASVSATGSVRAERTQRLAFRASGIVSEILVDEQDRVARGEVLARLDDRDLRLNLLQANAAVAVSQAQLDRTTAGPSELDLRSADATVAAASAAVQTAEAGVAAARANLARVTAGPSAEEIEISERSVEEARNALWGAQAQRDAICGRVGRGATDADCDQAQASVNRSEEAVAISELQLERLRAGASEAEVAAGQAQLDQALGQLASARAQLQRTQADTDKARSGASAAEIAVVQAQVDQAQVAVDIATSRLEDATLVSPAEGMVAGISVLEGDAAAAGSPVITLIDAAKYHVILSIDEIDIGRIAVGQEAEVRLDDYPESPIAGTVASIGAVGTSIQGIVVFDVRIDLEPTEVELLPYMTAAVDIVVMRADDALLVPNRAVRRDSAGRYVEALEGLRLVRIPIEIAATNVEYSVVTSGLEVGDEIVVSRPRGSLFQYALEGMNAD